MKKLILLSLIISLCFSVNNLKQNNLSIHTHKHLHIQGNTHAHEHSHIDNNSSIFYENQYFNPREFTLQNKYTDIKEIYLDLINKEIFKPPII